MLFERTNLGTRCKSTSRWGRSSGRKCFSTPRSMIERAIGYSGCTLGRISTKPALLGGTAPPDAVRHSEAAMRQRQRVPVGFHIGDRGGRNSASIYQATSTAAERQLLVGATRPNAGRETGGQADRASHRRPSERARTLQPERLRGANGENGSHVPGPILTPQYTMSSSATRPIPAEDFQCRHVGEGRLQRLDYANHRHTNLSILSSPPTLNSEERVDPRCSTYKINADVWSELLAQRNDELTISPRIATHL
jgi:hypothetical protein